MGCIMISARTHHGCFAESPYDPPADSSFPSLPPFSVNTVFFCSPIGLKLAAFRESFLVSPVFSFCLLLLLLLLRHGLVAEANLELSL